MHNLELKLAPVIQAIIVVVAMWAANRWAPVAEIAIPHKLLLSILLLMTGLMVATAGGDRFSICGYHSGSARARSDFDSSGHGVYKLIRNPMYLGMAMLLTGWGLYLANALAFVFIPIFVLYMNRFQIRPEERWMQEKFGEQYSVYAARVRRWI